MKNIRDLTNKIVKPIDEVTDLLNDKTRAQVHKVIQKITQKIKKITKVVCLAIHC